MTRADWVLVRTPLQPLCARLAKRRLAVLTYHRVEDGERFAAQLDWLAEHRRPTTLEKASEAIVGRHHLEPGSVLITFDDGHRSVVDVALPLLRERGIPGVVFVITNAVAQQEPFWWEEVTLLLSTGRRVSGLPSRPDDAIRAMKSWPDSRRVQTLTELRRDRAPESAAQLTREDLVALQAASIAIGNHTASHPCLDRCRDDTVEQEITAAHQFLTNVLGRPPTAFAYPNGNTSSAARSVLRSLGYGVAFKFDHRLQRCPGDDPFAVSRLRVNADQSLDRFRLIVGGLHPALHHLRGRP